MQDVYPEFYTAFRCIANRCEDSCCKDWDIDIDSGTEAFYQTVQGALGDKMRRELVTDAYGERVFKVKDGRCPFWNRDMLCDIFIGIGEEHLSQTCGSFPRVAIDYGDFCEHILSFACPEAARFMLRATGNPYAAFGGGTELEAAENGDDYMSFLLKARTRSVHLLLDRSLPFAYRLADCLEFNAQVQAVLDGSEPQPLQPADNPPASCRFIFDLHAGFEMMSERWRTAIRDAQAHADSLVITEDFTRDFEAFAQYYIYRYYLEAVRSGDVLYAVKRIVCAYLVTGKLDALFAGQGYPLPRMRILQRYSKEVEHSYDNTEAMNRAFDSDSRFSAENLMALLEQSMTDAPSPL